MPSVMIRQTDSGDLSFYVAKKDLEETIRRTDCDLVVIGTPIDLGRIIRIDKPSVRVIYELAERKVGRLEALVKKAVG